MRNYAVLSSWAQLFRGLAGTGAHHRRGWHGRCALHLSAPTTHSLMTCLSTRGISTCPLRVVPAITMASTSVLFFCDLCDKPFAKGTVCCPFPVDITSLLTRHLRPRVHQEPPQAILQPRPVRHKTAPPAGLQALPAGQVEVQLCRALLHLRRQGPQMHLRAWPASGSASHHSGR